MNGTLLTRLTLLLLWLIASVSAVAAPRPIEEDSGLIDGKSFDLIVVEATPGGIAMAVRAAREGLNVLLVNHNRHLGGILSSGLGVWDTLFEGRRAPIYDEVRQGIFEYYRKTYGENSPQYRDTLPGKSGHTNGKFEPRVAEMIFTELVAREPRVTVLKGFVPAAVQREGALLRSVTFRELDGTKSIRVRAAIFADCTYEGDLLALAKAPYRVGREARAEFDEPHAGVIFMRGATKPPTPAVAEAAAIHDTLKLRKFSGFQEAVLPESTGAADMNVQAFNYRTILTSDPANRIPVAKPAVYDPAYLKTLEYGSIVAPLPSRKIGWNRPQLVGPHQGYVEGDWGARQKIMDQFWQATLGLLYYLQNDPAVPADKRKYWRQYGLAKDEFGDNGHRPYEFYVREARRLGGRALFTEHDAMLAPGLHRAPVHADAVGITEWYLDTHACTPNRAQRSMDEGKMMLHHETFPGQVPYRTLLPQGVDNLLVPVCLSATHVAWGTIRLESTWMNIGESAGFAAALAAKNKTTPANLDSDLLVRELAHNRVMVSFFNDVDVTGKEPWVAAVQYFGTKGFFSDYNARPDSPLTADVAQRWIETYAMLIDGKPFDPTEQARKLPPESEAVQEGLSAGTLTRQLAAALKTAQRNPTIAEAARKSCQLKSETAISRGDACRLMELCLRGPANGKQGVSKK